ncbi:MAG: sigma-54-dependent Fis family transcriptional regulator [Deltaproteobacteria bacterium]|nr:sigma-54-dependent Fis family transcriptional regulator [Deltaproteobacteria bacterium]
MERKTSVNEKKIIMPFLKKAEDCFKNLDIEPLPARQYSLLKEGLDALNRLGKYQLSQAMKLIFIQYALEAFQHVFKVFAHHKILTDVLNIARQFAIFIGDRRSSAIIDLQLSTAFLILNELEASKKAYMRGLVNVEALGDVEISTSAANFYITYHTLLGEPRKVLEIYEQVRNSLQTETVIDPFVLTHTLPCAALSASETGKFQLGISILKGGIRTAKVHGYPIAEQCLRAQLGWHLAASGDLNQARYYINAGIDVPDERNVPLSQFWMERSMAYLDYAEGNLRKAYDQMKSAKIRATERGLTGMSYTAPWFLEMLWAFHNDGYPPIPGLEYEKEIALILKGSNLHLKGVAYRLKALDAKVRRLPVDRQFELLKLSEDCLLNVSGQLELGKTWMEIARIHIENNNIDLGKVFIKRAWQIYDHSQPNPFPEDLYRIMDPANYLPKQEPFWPRHDAFIKLLNQLVIPIPQHEVYHRLVALACNFFGAEMGAFFKYDSNSSSMKLDAGYNFPRFDKASSHAKWILGVISTAFQRKESLLRDRASKHGTSNSVLCIPIQVSKEKRVLYLESSIKMDIFHNLSEQEIQQLADNIGLHVEILINWNTRHEEVYRQNLGQLSAGKELMGPKILFSSETMSKVMEKADTAAKSDVPVLISGETGVGKELLAFYIHEQSPRFEMPFVTVDLSSVPESLIESELFGHEKGAFTGADKQKAGSFELADKGTIFIDEIGEIPISVQTKLLRVLQEKTFKRVGGIRTRCSDFRLIAATNRDLRQEVQNKRFRDDLFHRLNVIPLVIPPLRERKEDILLLANNFLKLFSRKHNKAFPFLTKIQEHSLTSYSWPGNVRELKNLMERIVIFQDTNLIAQSLFDSPVSLGQNSKITVDHFLSDLSVIPTLDEVQKDYINNILHLTRGKLGGKGGAAEILGMRRSTLYNRMKRLGISVPKF